MLMSYIQIYIFWFDNTFWWQFSDFWKIFRFFEILWPETWHLRHWLHVTLETLILGDHLVLKHRAGWIAYSDSWINTRKRGIPHRKRIYQTWSHQRHVGMFYVPLIKSFSVALETGQSQNLFKVSWKKEKGNERAHPYQWTW